MSRLRGTPRARRNRATGAALALVACVCTGCSYALFSTALPRVDRSRPVALIETTEGRELGATTELGVLFLGRTATEGPCRVRYFLGKTPLVEDGTVAGTGSSFYLADIDLKTQMIPLLERQVQPTDTLVAMFTLNGLEAVLADVHMADDPDVTGDVVRADAPLPPGATILVEGDDGYRFVGLVSGKATLTSPAATREYYTYLGLDRVREMLLVPETWPRREHFVHRPDDITITK